jgi:hypothetical protein
MKSNSIIKKRAMELRVEGKTYTEINEILKTKISKSTMSFWFKNTPLPQGYQRKIEEYSKYNIKKAQKMAFFANKIKRENYLNSIVERNKHLATILNDVNIAKVALSILYLGEGTKNLKRGSVRFGNSDPFVIDLFLKLIKKCYIVNQEKFRGTVLCRADQDIKSLETFWSKLTGIPLKQFYKARIDSRTIGKPTKKLEYKGVLVIDYFSADVFLDLMSIPKIIHKMGP